MVTKRWRFAVSDDGLTDELATALSRSRLLASLLTRRQIAGVPAAELFLSPKLLHLHDPGLLPGMQAAVERIDEAIQQRQPIAIFGDYDVDGISSTCLLYDFFRFIGYPVSYRLPNRLLEGYGLREESIRELAATGTRLIVTVDNGSSAVAAIDLARVLGVDVVITDHHQPPPELPQAAAHVNPWLPGSAYPFKDLAGVGVTFKLVWALSQRLSKQTKLSEKFRTFLLESLALVALGTISDVVPLLGENRVLAKFGLKALQQTRRPGLRKLVDSALDRDRDTKLDSSHIGYRLGPRLNAAGRLGHAETAIHLLLADEEPAAAELAQTLEDENSRRQTIERGMTEQARELVREQVDLSSDRAIVLAAEGWHAGVLGIVAARIAEEFSRPTLLLTVQDGKARGSARSVPGVHIRDALSVCSELLHGFGGHEMAAGVEMDSSLLASLRVALNAAIALAPENMVPEVEAEAEVRIADITPQFIDELAQLEPFGRCNPEPLLVARNVVVAGSPSLLGASGRHLAFFARQDGPALRAVAFGKGELFSRLEEPGVKLDMLFHPRLSRWRGRSNLELHVRDVQFQTALISELRRR